MCAAVRKQERGPRANRKTSGRHHLKYLLLRNPVFRWLELAGQYDPRTKGTQWYPA